MNMTWKWIWTATTKPHTSLIHFYHEKFFQSLLEKAHSHLGMEFVRLHYYHRHCDICLATKRFPDAKIYVSPQSIQNPVTDNIRKLLQH